MKFNITNTTFNPLQMIGLDGPGVPRRYQEVNFVDLLDKADIINKTQKNEILAEMNDLGVAWVRDGEDIEILEIFNDDTGEIYRSYNDLTENRGWTNGDELAVCSILMWGELDG